MKLLDFVKIWKVKGILKDKLFMKMLKSEKTYFFNENIWTLILNCFKKLHMYKRKYEETAASCIIQDVSEIFYKINYANMYYKL